MNLGEALLTKLAAGDDFSYTKAREELIQRAYPGKGWRGWLGIDWLGRNIVAPLLTPRSGLGAGLELLGSGATTWMSPAFWPILATQAITYPLTYWATKTYQQARQQEIQNAKPTLSEAALRSEQNRLNRARAWQKYISSGATGPAPVIRPTLRYGGQRTGGGPTLTGTERFRI